MCIRDSPHSLPRITHSPVVRHHTARGREERGGKRGTGKRRTGERRRKGGKGGGRASRVPEVVGAGCA
eukprot:3830981-Rhodomonas_salina.1